MTPLWPNTPVRIKRPNAYALPTTTKAVVANHLPGLVYPYMVAIVDENGDPQVYVFAEDEIEVVE